MRELPPSKHRKTHVMIKGNFLVTADEVGPGVPAFFGSLPKNVPEDRLAMARWLVSRDNPLTARVAVNRVWSQLFGQGLVETEEDFGTQGKPPSHPELLDWLAVRYMDHGWDTKWLVRLLVTSATYRQSSRDHGRSPPERSRQPPVVARSAFSARGGNGPRSGARPLWTLEPANERPSVFPPQPSGLWRAAFNGRDRAWTTSPGEDRYRRGLYTFWRRTIPYPSMTTFDAPSREICSVRRIRTNTPLQAFVTLNDPVYVEAAQALARRIIHEGGHRPEERCRYALRTLSRQSAQAKADR